MILSRALFGLVLLLQVQPPAPQDLAARRDKKLQSPFLKAAPWTTDYDKARAEARATGRPVFAYFTASYFN